MKLTITIIRDEVGGWEALYANDEIYEEGESLRVKDITSCIEDHSMKAENVEFIFKKLNNNKYFYNLNGPDVYASWNTKQYLSEYDADDFIEEEENENG